MARAWGPPHVVEPTAGARHAPVKRVPRPPRVRSRAQHVARVHMRQSQAVEDAGGRGCLARRDGEQVVRVRAGNAYFFFSLLAQTEQMRMPRRMLGLSVLGNTTRQRTAFQCPTK